MELLDLYNKCKRIPLGKLLFSRLVCIKAPYFRSVKPVIQVLDKNVCEISLKKRRRVLNHLNTVHAIAMCNVAELAAGMMTDVSKPKSVRWIPKGMNVQYLKKAKTNLRAVTKADHIDWHKVGDQIVNVNVFDDHNERVFTADICMNLKAR